MVVVVVVRMMGMVRVRMLLMMVIVLVEMVKKSPVSCCSYERFAECVRLRQRLQNTTKSTTHRRRQKLTKAIDHKKQQQRFEVASKSSVTNVSSNQGTCEGSTTCSRCGRKMCWPSFAAVKTAFCKKTYLQSFYVTSRPQCLCL